MNPTPERRLVRCQCAMGPLRRTGRSVGNNSGRRRDMNQADRRSCPREPGSLEDRPVETEWNARGQDCILDSAVVLWGPTIVGTSHLSIDSYEAGSLASAGKRRPSASNIGMGTIGDGYHCCQRWLS